MARPDLQGPRDSRVREDCQGCLEFRARKDTEDFLGWTEPKVTLDPQEKRGRMDRRDPWVPLDQLDLQDPEENVGGMVRQE